MQVAALVGDLPAVFLALPGSGILDSGMRDANASAPKPFVECMPNSSDIREFVKCMPNLSNICECVRHMRQVYAEFVKYMREQVAALVGDLPAEFLALPGGEAHCACPNRGCPPF